MENKTAEETLNETFRETGYDVSDKTQRGMVIQAMKSYASPIIEKHEALIAELEAMLGKWNESILKLDESKYEMDFGAATGINNCKLMVSELLNTYKPTK